MPVAHALGPAAPAQRAGLQALDVQADGGDEGTARGQAGLCDQVAGDAETDARDERLMGAQATSASTEERNADGPDCCDAYRFATAVNVVPGRARLSAGNLGVSHQSQQYQGNA